MPSEVTALLSASKPSAAERRRGDEGVQTLLGESWTVMYLTKESKETPEYMRE